MKWVTTSWAHSICSDVDPHLSYADPDPQNLINADPDPGQYNHQIDEKPSSSFFVVKSVP